MTRPTWLPRSQCSNDRREFRSTVSFRSCGQRRRRHLPGRTDFVEGRMPNEEQNDDPLRLLRQACTAVIRTLPKARRRTPEWLDPNAIAGGLLEALLGFPHSRTDEGMTRLAKDIFDRARADGHMLLAIRMSSPSLEAWDRAEGGDSAHIKEKEFFVRLMENYDLAMLIGGLDAGSDDEQRALITARIRRRLDADRSSNESGDWNSRRDELRKDVVALYERAAAVLGEELLASHCGSTAPDCYSRFLQIVGRRQAPDRHSQGRDSGRFRQHRDAQALRRRLVWVAPGREPRNPPERAEAMRVAALPACL